jgi:hypothetical protein
MDYSMSAGSFGAFVLSFKTKEITFASDISHGLRRLP